MELSIRYIGLPVVNVEMTDVNNTITVKAKATKIASIAAKMDNTYISHYSDNYLPNSYKKIIHQKDYHENRVTEYFRATKTAKKTSYINYDKNKVFPINSESRDFFSSLFYLRTVCDQPFGELYLDANSLIWKANYKNLGKELINTELGKLNAIKIKLTFQKISDKETENTDMLTNNLVTEEKSLIFWFSDDERHIPLKAKFMMKPFAVVWKLENYSE
ncbi:MAG: DUF3108 domain-containing protein [Candidatus Cloacimonetes bacterium]|nr:DUF3108 domain-containing protein [Candidatus Cloacimonadota bacterium]